MANNITGKESINFSYYYFFLVIYLLVKQSAESINLHIYTRERVYKLTHILPGGVEGGGGGGGGGGREGR